MKKILFMIMTVLGWINLTSCNDYLDIVPKGNKIPTTLADLKHCCEMNIPLATFL